MSRRTRRRSGHGLKSWNFWTPITGTVYGVRGHYRGNPRRYIYGGKTTQRPWTKRIEDHLWARHWERAPKFWAHTVLGYRPGGTVQECIDAGGVFIIWQARTVPLILSLVEVIVAIKLRRPVHNRQWNTGNRRRSGQREIQSLRVQQALVQESGLPMPPQPVRAGGGLRIAAVIAVLFGVLMFLPGMPGADGVLWVRDWVLAHRAELIGWSVLVGGLVFVGPAMLKRKRRRRSRRRRAPR